MKFPRFSLGNDLDNLKKFEKLSDVERSIVFYAENIASMNHFKSLILELTEKMNLQICYITSVKDDPILSSKNQRILPFYIGYGAARSKFFLFLRAKILVMDMPDLDTFHIKRSKIYPVHYIYIFHSIVSTHTIYRRGAFDHFDSIFCVGPHHVKEIRATEQLYNLKQKNLVACGYGLLDKLQKNKPVKNQKRYTKDGRKKILIAPSWGKNGLLETNGLELVKILLDAGYHVTVRPHPMTIRKWPKIIKTIKNEFKDNTNFEIETDASSFESLYSAYGLISDWSGIGFEYAFVCERPVLYIDVPEKILNVLSKDISLEPIEVAIRNKIGHVIPPNNLEIIPKLIEGLDEYAQSINEQIKDMRSQIVFNIGKSAKIGAEYIQQLNDKL